MQLEKLEDRRLMSAVTFSLNAASGVLTATGTTGDDVVQMTKAGSQLLVIHKTRPAGQNVPEASVPFTLRTFPAAKVKQIVVNGGKGNDRLEIENNVKVNATLDSGAGAQGGWKNVLRGGGGNDTIYVRPTTLAANVKGGDGNDTFYVQDDVRSVDGEAGNDKIIDQAAPDSHQYKTESWVNYTGGAGNDTIDFSAHDRGMLLCNSDFGGFTASGFFDAGKTPALYNQVLTFDLYGFETFVGTKGDDVIYGDKHDNTLKGGLGDDELYGGDGNDTLYGGDGNDLLKGSKGNDILLGQAGYDGLFGEAGDDTLYGAGDNFADILSGGAGKDAAGGDEKDLLVSIESTVKPRA